MLVCLVSGKGAPGVTTTAVCLSLVWPRPVLLVDADPRGGDVGWTFGAGRDTAGRGVLGAHLATRREPWVTALQSHVVALVPGESRWLLPGLDDASQAALIDWPGLAAALAGLAGVDVIVDAGEARPATVVSPVRAAADVTVIVGRSSLAGVHAIRSAASALHTGPETAGAATAVGRVVSVIVGIGRPYREAEVTRSLQGVAPVVGEMPWCPKDVDALMTGHANLKYFSSSPLHRAATVLYDRLETLVAGTGPDGAAESHARSVLRGHVFVGGRR